MSNVFFISDLHLGHNDIHLKFRKEFVSELDHAEYAIRCWNSVVRKNDVVKVLGDHDVRIREEVLQAHPNIGWVAGTTAHKGVVISHVPVHPGELIYRSWKYNLHGHIHDSNNNPAVSDDSRYFNVNVDVSRNGFFPQEFKSICREAGWNDLPCLKGE